MLEDVKDREVFVMDLMVVSMEPPKQTKSGYMVVLNAGDRTRTLTARWFGDKENCIKFYNNTKTDQIYSFTGEYSAKYNSFTIKEMVPAANPNQADFNHSVLPLEEHRTALFGYIGNMDNAHIRALLESIFADSTIRDEFLVRPAAKSYHHSFDHGLVVHTLEMLRMAKLLCEMYPRMDRDLLYCGCILHDLGKIREMESRMGTRYTDEGELVSHIPIACMIAADHMNMVDGFPEKLRMQVLHLILSHHGNPDRSPSFMAPKTLEAVALHQLDAMSASIAPVHAAAEDGTGWLNIRSGKFLV